MDTPDAAVTADAEVPECEDADGDGYGEGADCRGPDCDDHDGDRNDGCDECDHGSEACYGGPANTIGVGPCHRGVRDCTDGVWGRCLGAIEPTPEVCDSVDQDCDGDVDDGVLSTCGNCDPDCHLTCAGIGCVVPLEPGENAERTDEGATQAIDGGGDITQRSMWIFGNGNAVVYRIDTRALEITAAYALDPARGFGFSWSAFTDSWGNVFLSNDQSVTRIDAGGCGDVNGDGVVQTSVGADDVYPLGEDDCVRWQVSYPLSSNGALGVMPDGRVWLAGERRLTPIDGETGEPVGDAADMSITPEVILADTDGRGMWVARSSTLCHLDADALEEDCHTIDGQGFREIDLAADGGLIALNPLAQVDPVQNVATPILLEDIFDIAVTSTGILWAQPYAGDSFSNELYRFDEGLDQHDVVPLAVTSRHIAADRDGQVWTTSAAPFGYAAVYDGATGEHLGTFFDECDGGCLANLELYGDPSGVRYRRTVPSLYERAEVHAILEAACDAGADRLWRGLSWEQSDGSDILVEARTAPDRERLARARWTLAGRTPPEPGAIPLGLTADAGDAFVEVRARLRSENARLDRVDLSWSCAP